MSSVTLATRIEESIQSGQAGLWIRTHEPDEALKTLADLAKEYSEQMADEPGTPIWELKVWDVVNGLQDSGKAPIKIAANQKADPSIVAVRALIDVCEMRRQHEEQVQDPSQLPPEDSHSIVLVLRNGHRELVNNNAANKEMLMAVQHLLTLGKAYKCHIVIMSFPGVEIPIELVEQLWVLDHELPDYDGRKEIITDLLECSGIELPKKSRLDVIIKATGGLTRGQVEGVSALSLMKHGEIVTDEVWGLKSEALNKRGLLRLWKGKENFDNLGGLVGAKKFCKLALKPGKSEKVRAKAILLLGIPGTGKSAFAKALGNEMNRPTLSLDIGSLMGSLVGQTEEHTREALKIADAMEPCQLFIDEIEKALGGSGGENDGGVNSRLKGTLLTWLNDHESDVFLIATANNISAMPPEFTRAERFDAIFFMDLPDREQKDVIWDMYLKYFELEEQERPNDKHWTGAEIKACCRLAAMLGMPIKDTSKQVIPVMMTASEQIAELRQWAHHRCLSAETGEIYENPAMKADPDEQPAAAGRDLGARVPRKVMRHTKDKHND